MAAGRLNLAGSPEASTALPPIQLELLYVFQSRLHQRMLEVSPAGVRFLGSSTFYSDIYTLVLSHATTSGEDLPCPLSYPPGAPPVTSDALAFPTSYGEFVRGVHPEGRDSAWWKDSARQVCRAPLSGRSLHPLPRRLPLNVCFVFVFVNVFV
jgi:hypothetical protein